MTQPQPQPQTPCPSDTRPAPSAPPATTTDPDYDELAELVFDLSAALSQAVTDGCVTDLTLTQRQVDILWHVDHHVGQSTPADNAMAGAGAR